MLPEATETAPTPVVVVPDKTPGELQQENFDHALTVAMKEAPPPDPDDLPGTAPPPGTEGLKSKEPGKEEPPKDDRGALGKARRLFEEGDVDGALAIALGVEVDAIDGAQLKSKHWKALVQRERAAKVAVQEAQSQAEAKLSGARQAAQALVPLVRAVQAYQQGDFEGFTKLATGDTLEGFQRKILDQLKRGGAKAPSDPALVARLDALERERAAERTRAAQLADENKRLQQAQAESRWVGEIAQELSQDDRFAKMAQRPAFLQKVIEVQRAHWNPRTHMTLDATEAAELIWDREGYGDVAGTPSPNGHRMATAPQMMSRTTNLNPSQAAEAAPDLVSLPWSKENQDKILESFSRKARSEARAR